MNRKDFLAIIPSLSALPFLASSITKKSDRIEIIQPEEMNDEIKKAVRDDCSMEIPNDEIRIYRDGICMIAAPLSSTYIENIESEFGLNTRTRTRLTCEITSFGIQQHEAIYKALR